MIPPKALVLVQATLLPVAEVAQVGVYVASFRIWRRQAGQLFVVFDMLDKNKSDLDGYFHATIPEQVLNLIHDCLHKFIELYKTVTLATESIIQRLVEEDSGFYRLDCVRRQQSGGA